MRRFLPAAIAAISLLADVVLADADRVATWSISGIVDSNDPLPFTQKASHTSVSDLIKSASLTGVLTLDGFIAHDWPTGARDPNKFFSFSVTAIPGYEIDYSHITATLAGVFNETTDWELRSSVDNYASALDGGLIYGADNFTPDISALGKQLGTVTFRFYAFNITGFNSCGLYGSPIGGVDLNVWGEVLVAPPSLAEWELAGTIDSATPLVVTTTDDDLTAGNLQKSPVLGSANFASAFMATGWPIGAVDLTRYLSFSTKANAGFEIDYDRLEFSIYNSNSGTAEWQVRSSADGFRSVLDAGKVFSIVVDGEDVVADVEAVGTREGSVEFRVYLFENTGSSNADRRGFRGTPQGGIDLNVFGDLNEVIPSNAAMPVRATQLLQNQPNPFNPRTSIRYSLNRSGPVKLELFDVRGHHVRTLVDATQAAGWQRAEWDGRDGQGRQVASGVYHLQLRADGHVESRRMTLLK